jgi:hypothetical protein
MRLHVTLALVSTAIGLSSLWLSGAQAQDLGEWRLLTAEEEKARIGDSPSNSIDPAMIKADFNGDGRIDTALIAVRKSDQSRDLIVKMDDRIHVLVRSEVSGVSIGAEDGLGLAKPGHWDTICGNAFRELQGELCESEKYPKAVILRNPGLLRISSGEAVLYFWNGKKKAFESLILRN